MRKLSIGLTLFLVSVFLALSPVAPAFAQPMTQEEIKGVQWWTHWVADACSGASSSGDVVDGNIISDDQIPGQDNREKIWNYLISLGFKPVEAAGIVGNIGREGVYDPTNIEDPAGTTKDWDVLLSLTEQNQGYGLIGFTPGRSLAKGDTLGADWSGISGVKVNEENFYYISTQLSVVYGYMKNSKSPSGKNMLKEFQDRSTSPAGAALAFEDLVENPAVLASDERIQLANDAMRDFGNKSAASIPSATVGSSGDVCCPPGGAGPGATAEGADDKTTIWNYLVTEMRLSSIQAAGIMGNIEQESGFSPNALNSSSGAFGIIQWLGGRLTSLESFAASQHKPKNDITVQLDFMKNELNGSYKSSVLDPIENSNNLEQVTRIWLENYEIPCTPGSSACDAEMSIRLPNATNILQEYGNGSVPGTTGSSTSCGSTVTNEDLHQTIEINTPGKFIKLPSKYTCPGHETTIDSRIAANVAYLATKYNFCTQDGLADGHLSHGAGLAVDVIPRTGGSKDAWKSSVETAARDIGWWGDSANQAQGAVNSCANYGSGDYGQCMHEVYPEKFPKWMRWLGYNGAYCHGDPWHIYGGCGAHLHIGWDTPNHDGVSPSIISEPRQSVYAFPSSVPPDLQSLVGSQ